MLVNKWCRSTVNDKSIMRKHTLITVPLTLLFLAIFVTISMCITYLALFNSFRLCNWVITRSKVNKICFIFDVCEILTTTFYMRPTCEMLQKQVGQSYRNNLFHVMQNG